MAWEPFRITATLRTPVTLNHPWLHLDGILSHLVYQHVLGRDYYNLPTKQVVHLRDDRYRNLLSRQHHIPHASISFFDPPDAAYRSLQYFKRFEAEGFPGRRKVQVGSGHYRNWMLRWVYLAAHTVTFYGCGNLPEIRELLGELTHLGNDNRVGWGKLAALTVERTDADYSLVKDGRAMRPIPTRLLRDWSDSVPLAWRPPYWAAENVEDCAPPGAEVTLAG